LCSSPLEYRRPGNNHKTPSLLLGLVVALATEAHFTSHQAGRETSLSSLPLSVGAPFPTVFGVTETFLSFSLLKITFAP
jgi:hypothetical protein